MEKKNLFSHLIITALFLMLFVTLKTYALDYTITFSGTGASTTVESVIVQNLTKGTTVTVPTGNSLKLSDAPNAVEQLNADDDFIRIYPNLIEGKSTVSFFAKQAGSTQLNAFSIDGRKIAGITEKVQTGVNSFQLSLPNGSFAIQVVGNGYTYTAKMINQTGKQSKPEIAYIGTVKPASSAPQKSKSTALSTITMTYATGDQLLYKAVSGPFSTVVTDVPTASKTTNFDFVACADADGNNYTSVTIGTQTWMVENLKTTKYNDGTSIPNVTDNTAWYNLSTPAYCWYNNDATTYKNTYGALYNWYAVNTAKLAPTGWHVPTDTEWTTLTTFLGSESLASYKLKETGATHWNSPNTGTTNSSGFTALPGGSRYVDGTYISIGNSGQWWSSSENSNNYVWFRSMNYNQVGVTRDFRYGKVDGFSVRCVKDTIPTVTDIDSNIYHTVQIGTQTWMVENLKTTHYRTGEAIGTTTPTTKDIYAESAPNYQWAYNGDENLAAKYGRLYTWYAAADSRNIAPVGWHVASEAEWITLENYLISNGYNYDGITTGNKIAKSLAATTDWYSYTGTGCIGNDLIKNNSSGFTALPGGWRDYYGTFDGVGNYGCWWSSSEYRATDGWSGGLNYNNASLYGDGATKCYGFSVRCVRDTIPTVSDIDGNIYHTVQIGTQTWMVENLKTTHYRTGEAIGTTTPATLDISAESAPNYQWAYNGDENLAAKYGRLYTWYAAADSRNIAPTGWHVASDAEWTTLENYLAANGYNYDGTTSGNKIAKSLAATTDWYSYTGTGTIGNDLTKNNTSGFTALPGGIRYNYGSFYYIGYEGLWWSSTEYGTTNAWGRYLGYDIYNLFRSYYTKSAGFSVRCVRDDTAIGICPLVISTDPVNGATSVPYNKVITATFNEKMDQASITQSSFTLLQGTTLIPGNVSYIDSDSTASFVPTNPLLPFTTYKGTIKNTVKDKSGNVMQADYVWTFTTMPLVTLISTPLLGGTTTGGGAYAVGATVTVTATPSAGYVFVNWTENGTQVSPVIKDKSGISLINNSMSGTEVSTSSSYTFAMPARNRTLMANFAVIVLGNFSINLSSNPPAGGTTSGGGTFNSGASVTVTAVANIGYIFTNWTENGTSVSTNSSYTFTMPAGNRTLTANFAVIVLGNFSINLLSNPLAGGTTSGGGIFIENSVKIVTASPNTGYTFANWTEGGVSISTSATYQLAPLVANRTLVANFLINTYTLTVNATNGTVAKNPNQSIFNYGSTVLLTATASTGYIFTGWSGNASGSANPLSVTMDQNKTITANFTVHL